jgi:hypothetical protein
MRKMNMKVAPLSQLYEQKNDYEAHRRKLERIMTEGGIERKEKDADFEKWELTRQNLQKFEKRLFNQSAELTKQNERMVQKL